MTAYCRRKVCALPEEAKAETEIKFNNMEMHQIGGSKCAEYLRTIDMLKRIFEEQGIYFVLAFLYDSQYDRDDIAAMMDLIHPGKNSFSDNLNKAK